MFRKLMEMIGERLGACIILKYDPLRDSKKWTIIIGPKRLTDTDDPFDALLNLIGNSLESWYEIFRRQI